MSVSGASSLPYRMAMRELLHLSSVGDTRVRHTVRGPIATDLVCPGKSRWCVTPKLQS